MDDLFKRASISFDLGSVGFKEKIEVRSDSKASAHDVYSLAVPVEQPFSRQTRLFALTKDRLVRSLDIKIASMRASVGEGADIQNAGQLRAENQTLELPGAFAGEARHLFDARLSLRERVAICR